MPAAASRARAGRLVACVGECMVELAGVEDSPRLGVAGDSLNIGVYLARALGPGRVAYVSRLGRDPFSDRIADFICSEGIATDWLERVADALPGLYAITVQGGERHFHYWRSQAPVRQLLARPDRRVQGLLRDAGGLVVTGITLAVLGEAGVSRLLACARASKGMVAYVVNHRPALWRSRAHARQVHLDAISAARYVFASDDDAQMLWPGRNPWRALLAAAGDAEVVRTLGAAGCEVLREGRRLATASAPPVKAVDSTAAGDSFCARYLAGVLRGEAVDARAQAACELAAKVVRHHGAIIPVAAM